MARKGEMMSGTMDKRKIAACVERAWNAVSRQIRHYNYEGIDGAYCPLFFQELTEHLISLSEIDSCSTSIALSILALKKDRLSDREKEMIKKCCRLLLKIRDESGGWPSIVLLSPAINVEKMEGTINDTYFALDALIRLGMPTYASDIVELTAEEQIEILHSSLRWLLNNRLHRGWYYNEIEFLREEDRVNIIPAILPTSNVLTLLGGVIPILTEFNSELRKHSNTSNLLDKNNKLIGEIHTAFSEGIEWLRNSRNEDGGYGRFPGSQTTITNTILALRALLMDNTFETFEWTKQVLKRLLKESPKTITNLSDEDIFEGYDQILVCKSEGRETFWRRTILHEKFVEGLLLQVFVDIITKNWNIQGKEKRLVDELTITEKLKLRKLNQFLLEKLMTLQKTTGTLIGAFKSRRQTLSYPIYAIFGAIKAFEKILRREMSWKVISLKKIGIGMVILLSPIVVTIPVGLFYGWGFIKQILFAVILEIIVSAGYYGVSYVYKGLGVKGEK